MQQSLFLLNGKPRPKQSPTFMNRNILKPDYRLAGAAIHVPSPASLPWSLRPLLGPAYTAGVGRGGAWGAGHGVARGRLGLAHLEVFSARLQLSDDVVVDVARRTLTPVWRPVTVEIIT